jgi:hypothetical protein
MKLPSIQAMSLCASKLLAIFLMGIAFAGVSQASAAQIADDDVLALLSLNLGGRDVAVAAWSNMNPSEKQTLRDQAARIAVMARGAELDGFAASPDVARALQWGRASFLADAWEKKVSSETDLSDSAARAFYEVNRQWYVGEGETPMSFEQSKARVRQDMVRAAIMEKLEVLNFE